MIEKLYCILPRKMELSKIKWENLVEGNVRELARGAN